jgi:ribosomal protein S4
MQINSLVKFKKNSKLIRLNKLYFELLKTKHILSFFIGGLKKNQLLKLYTVVSTHKLFLKFLEKLEYRLEVILLKSGVVLTGKQAKQLILHNHILVNGLRVKAYNYNLKLGDLISLEKFYINNYKILLICNFFKTIGFFSFLKKKRITKKLSLIQTFVYFKFPFSLEINFKIFEIRLVRKPVFNEFFLPKFFSLYDCNQLYFIL